MRYSSEPRFGFFAIMAVGISILFVLVMGLGTWGTHFMNDTYKNNTTPVAQVGRNSFTAIPNTIQETKFYRIDFKLDQTLQIITTSNQIQEISYQIVGDDSLQFVNPEDQLTYTGKILQINNPIIRSRAVPGESSGEIQIVNDQGYQQLMVIAD